VYLMALITGLGFVVLMVVGFSIVLSRDDAGD
jgi:hypothetical protein